MSKTKVYVGGLVDDVGNDRLHRTFEKFGKIKKVWVARNPGSRGYAFIDFYEPEHALTASEEMNGKHVFGTNLKVELSTNGIDYTKFSEKYRNYDDRRGGRDHDSRREDRERERRRSERDRDYRRRSPPYHSREEVDYRRTMRMTS
ncbi:probable splicing factor, arginine/serine-rich 6 [Argopecten irradians]|uniref:probable splicing factor, arginine/serine-rich 6 n=1 Tax=Argopecten irradians TaxID=31199 RepID=UPI003721E3AD